MRLQCPYRPPRPCRRPTHSNYNALHSENILNQQSEKTKARDDVAKETVKLLVKTNPEHYSALSFFHMKFNVEFPCHTVNFPIKSVSQERKKLFNN